MTPVRSLPAETKEPPFRAAAPVVELRGGGPRLVARDRGETLRPGHDLANVVPFVRARHEAAAEPQAPVVVVPAAAAGRAAETMWAKRWALALLCSAAIHAGLFFFFHDEAPPAAGIGLESISVELMLGANMAAGPTPEKGESDVSVPAPAMAPNPAKEMPPEPQLAEAERPARRPETAEATPAEPAPAEPVTEAAAAVEAPAETKAVEAVAPVTPVQTVPEQPPAPAPKVAKPTDRKHAAKHRREAKRQQETKREERRRAAAAAGERNNSRSLSPASTAAGGVGRGRSELNSNYRGMVAAHLARYKQYPAEARSRGAAGMAVVSFSLSGSGSVTSARLARSSGVSSLDQEVTAMVRRASPFPAPPDGRPVSFTVPVSFRVQ